MKDFRVSRFLLLPILVFGVLGLAGCNDENDITGTGGALATLTVDTPDSAQSGQPFNVEIRALAIGVTNVRNGRVQVTLPTPLTVTALDPSAGTTATFSNSAGGGAQVTWVLNTLDSNTQSTLQITAMGVLAPGEAARSITVQAVLTADGISAGDADAEDVLQLRPL